MNPDNSGPTQVNGDSREPMRRPDYVLVGLGVLLLLVPLMFAVAAPPHVGQVQVFLRIVTSLGGALVAAAIPGILHVQFPGVRAAGALAVLVLFFRFNPIDAVSPLGPGPDKSAVSVGHEISYDGHKQYERSGFSFANNAVVSWGSGDADILAENAGAGSGLAHFFLQYNAGEIFKDAPQDQTARSGIVELPGTTFDRLKECPETGYRYHRVSAKRGGVYCVRTRDGRHFAKLVVREVLADRIAFDWAYQSNGLRRFE